MIEGINMDLTKEQADVIDNEIIPSIIREVEKSIIVIKIPLSDLVDTYPDLIARFPTRRPSIEDLYCRMATTLFNYGIFTYLEMDMHYRLSLMFRRAVTGGLYPELQPTPKTCMKMWAELFVGISPF